jgi:hypothetical protein
MGRGRVRPTLKNVDGIVVGNENGMEGSAKELNSAAKRNDAM